MFLTPRFSLSKKIPFNKLSSEGKNETLITRIWRDVNSEFSLVVGKKLTSLLSWSSPWRGLDSWRLVVPYQSFTKWPMCECKVEGMLTWLWTTCIWINMKRTHVVWVIIILIAAKNKVKPLNVPVAGKLQSKSHHRHSEGELCVKGTIWHFDESQRREADGNC